MLDTIDAWINRLFDWSEDSYSRTMIAVLAIFGLVLGSLVCLVAPIAGLIALAVQVCR